MIGHGEQSHPRARRLPHCLHNANSAWVSLQQGRQNNLPTFEKIRDSGPDATVLAPGNGMARDKLVVLRYSRLDHRGFDASNIGNNRFTVSLGHS